MGVRQRGAAILHHGVSSARLHHRLYLSPLRVAFGAAHGGGSTWTSYSIDQSTGLVYVPVGNPAPDFSSDGRPGSNLYTDSIVALDASTGRLAWYHQFVPHDSHDYDMAAAPAIITTQAGKKLMIAAGKNAMLYAIDLNTHAIVYSLPVSEISNANMLPTVAGVHTCPGWIGGVEWNGPAYDPETNAVYVNSVHLCGLYKRGETPYSKGAPFFGGEFVPDPMAAW
jgi:alcohol dehydrogenase (cytochrome c)